LGRRGRRGCGWCVRRRDGRRAAREFRAAPGRRGAVVGDQPRRAGPARAVLPRCARPAPRGEARVTKKRFHSDLPDPLQRAPIAIAHRGGALLPTNVGKENSLEAFANAIAIGYEYLETDLRTTRDG